MDVDGPGDEGSVFLPEGTERRVFRASDYGTVLEMPEPEEMHAYLFPR
jgi:hypothetical protein